MPVCELLSYKLPKKWKMGKGHTKVPSLTNCLGISANSVRRSDMVLMERWFLEVSDVEVKQGRSIIG